MQWLIYQIYINKSDRFFNVINIGNDNDLENESVAQMIIDQVKIKDISFIKWGEPEAQTVVKKKCSNKLAVSLLGFSPSTSVEDGIKNTIEWMKSKYF